MTYNSALVLVASHKLKPRPKKLRLARRVRIQDLAPSEVRGLRGLKGEGRVSESAVRSARTQLRTD